MKRYKIARKKRNTQEPNVEPTVDGIQVGKNNMSFPSSVCMGIMIIVGTAVIADEVVVFISMIAGVRKE